MEVSLTAPLTDEEARRIMRLRPAEYKSLVASGQLVCTGSIRVSPVCSRKFPTILDILYHRLRACVQVEIYTGLITEEEVNAIVSELIGRLEEGPPIPGGGFDPKGNLYLDSIWLLCRPITRKASRRLATTLAQTFLRCAQQFGYYPRANILNERSYCKETRMSITRH